MLRKSMFSALLALTVLGVSMLFAPRVTQADGIDAGKILKIKPLPDLVITDIQPVYVFVYNKGFLPAPDQIWVKVSNKGAGDLETMCGIQLGWGTTIWYSEETDPDLDYELVSPMAAGGYQWIKMSSNGYNLRERGAYWFLEVDRHNWVQESNENNNKLDSTMKP